MTDIILNELKIIVEQAVRPVRATLNRKLRMREELLGHVTAIFEEEVAKLGNEHAALDQTKRRFGDPRELTGQLQEVVPRWDRLARLGEVCSFRGPHESLRHYVGRMMVFAVLVFAISIVISLPIACYLGKESELAVRLHVMLCMSVGQIPLTMGILLLTHGMYRALYGMPSHRSWRMTVVYGVISTAFFPLLAFGWYWSLTGDLIASLSHFRSACVVGPLVPVLLALLSKQSMKQMRSYEEWTSLEIEE